MTTSKGYLQYNGTEPVYSFGESWSPGRQIAVETICKSFGERSGDMESGPIFISWLLKNISTKPAFSLHLSQETVNEQANSTGGTTTVESGPVRVANSLEQATSQLTHLRQQTHGQQIPVTDSRAGSIQTSPAPSTRTVRAENRLGSVRDILDSQKQGTEAMTGDMLDQENGLAGGVVITPPLVPFQGEERPSTAHIVQPRVEKKSETVSEVFVANPSPTTVNSDTQDFSNIQTIDQTKAPSSGPGTGESNPMTGDDLDNETSPSSAPTATSLASAARGNTRPAVQGSSNSPEITLDHIVRAPDLHQAIDAVNKCQDRSILTLAKRQLDNDGSRASQRISTKIEARMLFLKQRGH